MSRQFGKQWHRRGITLVELMIVVAIIGILAAIGGAGFTKMIKKGKIAKLEQFAMDIARGEEEFRSRQGRYYPLMGGSAEAYGAMTEVRWRNLLGFSQVVPQGVTIQIETGNAGAMPGALADCSRNAINFTTAWFCVIVTQDLNPSEALNTQIIYGSGADAPLTVNEGT